MAESLVWIDVAGAELTLVKTRGATGRHMPPAIVREEVVPDGDGSRVRSVRFDARQVVVPIYVEGPARTDLIAAVRTLARAMNPKRGEGTLRSTAADGEIRDLRCRYVDGLGLEETFPQFAVPTLLFRASDPFWYAATDQIVEYRTGTPSTFFPLFPLTLSSSTVFGDVIVDNTGDVEAWPVWLVTGPGSDLVLRNVTTGYVIDLPITLAAGESLTIDTRPGERTVLKQDGTNLFPNLTDDSALWPLIEGDNRIQIEFSAATAASAVQLAYRRRFLTP